MTGSVFPEFDFGRRILSHAPAGVFVCPIDATADLIGVRTGGIAGLLNRRQHWGKELPGGRVFETISAAERYLSKPFAEMFPEHKCSRSCGPTTEPDP